MLQLGRRMGARLFFGTLASRGCGELTFPGLKADPPNRSDSRLLGLAPPPLPFRAGRTASLTQAFLPILVFGASPRRVAQRLVMKRAQDPSIGTPLSSTQREMTLLLSSHQTARELRSCPTGRETRRFGYALAMVRVLSN